jgi:hypothetical protein
VPDLGIGQAQPDQLQTVRFKRPRGRPGIARPADPYAAGLAHHRLERGDQAAWAGPPRGTAVGVLDPVYRQAASHYHEVVARLPVFRHQEQP